MYSNNAIPGPRGSLLLGSLREFRDGMFDFMERLRNEFGGICRFRLGPRQLILLNDPSLVEQVLVIQNRRFRKHYATRLLTPVLGNGLLLNEGESWLRQRRRVQPAFSRRFAGEFVSIVNRHAAELADSWRAVARRDLYRDMTRLTVGIAAEAFLGIRDRTVMDELGDSLDVIHSDFEHRFLQPFSLPPWIPSSRNRRLQSAVRHISSLIDGMIELRRGDAKQKHDALSLLLRAEDEHGQRMSQQLLRDEVMTLLLAGHDTTANALTWTCILLSQHPDVAEQLKAEQAGKKSISDETSADFATRVIQESMRLYPPAYMIGRESLCEIELGGYRIGKGSSVVMSPWVMHRDPRFFTEPERFLPDRWSDDYERSLPRYAYFPFGGGPRVCIGRELAMLEATAILRSLAGEFNICVQSERLRPWPTVTLRVREPVIAEVTSENQVTRTAAETLPPRECPHHQHG